MLAGYRDATPSDVLGAPTLASARSPLYLAILRFLSNPCFRTFPLLSHTCHSHFVWLCLMIISSYMAAVAGPLGQCPVSAQAHCIGRFGLQR